MKVWPVDSRETMLKPQDIFAVAAYEYKENLNMVRPAAKKYGVSPERMAYTLMIKQYSDPRLLRIRCGNTLFTIAALPHGFGFVRGYNGDTAPNYVANIVELIESAKKMGFKVLISHGTDAAMKATKLAARKSKRISVRTKFDSHKKMMAVIIGGGV